ncbi:MAG: hypothetical protein HY057_03940 [Rhodospirillales bacterium]|nr:hypothetical protein [Rhodospirillales bacterium]
MPVETFGLTNASIQSVNTYVGNNDGNWAVAKRIVDAFAPHAQATPDMTVRVDAGSVFNGTTLTEVAAQSTGTIAAPTANPRIDRVVIDRATGAVSVVAGVEAAAPVPPAIPAGKAPVAQVALVAGQTQITNATIADERSLSTLGLASGAFANIGTLATLNANPLLKNDGSGNAVPAIPMQSKSASYTFAAADRGQLIQFTATATATLPGVATTGNDWWVALRCSASTLTVSAASGQIDGGSSITLTAGQSCFIVAGADNYWSVGKPAAASRALKRQVFTSSGTFTPVPGITDYKVTVVGGGGSGHKDTDLTAKGSGGGGGAAIKWVTGLSSNVAVTVGAGGNGVGSQPQNGNPGGTSSFGAYVSASGGGGGTGASQGTAGAGSSGDINIIGYPGNWGVGGGAPSPFFGPGTAANGGGPTSHATNYGSGSGACGNGVQSGNGAPGIVIVEWIE